MNNQTRHRVTLRPELAALLAPRRAALRAECEDEMIQTDPRLAGIAAAMHPGPVPLDAREMIPDATLRRWMRGEPEFQRGEIPADLQRELTVLLADLCGEMLSRRYAMDGPERGARR